MFTYVQMVILKLVDAVTMIANANAFTFSSICYCQERIWIWSWISNPLVVSN